VSSGERRVLDQYLARYAEPEAKYAAELGGEYAAAVVMPLAGEEPGCLDALSPALAQPGGALPVLLVAVINGRRESQPALEAQNQALLADWRARARRRRELRPLAGGADGSRRPARAELLQLDVSGGSLDVLVLDAATGDHRFPPKQGVGLARRIGCDVVIGLARAGQVRARYIGAADGDVHLPAGYVESLCRAPASAALLFSFEHTSSGDTAVDEATRLVELSWRHYLLGTSWAGSPYAYHSLGSCLAPEVVAYAQVRGYPRRLAAEDFHLLAKLAKVGWLEVPEQPVVSIAARRSTRVPFGTGQAVERLLRGPASVVAPSDECLLHDPRVFEALRLLIEALRAFALRSSFDPHPPAASAHGEHAALPVEVLRVVGEHANRWRRLLAEPLAGCPSDGHRLHRTFEAFDALAILRAVHAFRDAGLPPVPWRTALGRAPFLTDFRTLGDAGAATPERALEAARAAERALPSRRGLGSPQRV
jgi:hypothetical protein